MFKLSKSQGLMSKTLDDMLATILKNSEIIMTEQINQRIDLTTIKRKLHFLINDLKIQEQISEYFDGESKETDLDNKTSQQLEDK